jgi:hypothetical protein
VNILSRIRRWWKPAHWADDHPLSVAEREEREPITFREEAAK